MKDKERSKRLRLRIAFVVGLVLIVSGIFFAIVELKTPHNNLFTSDIDRHFFKRYGDECDFSFGEEGDDDLIEVSVSGCDYGGVTAYYNTKDGVDDLASVLAPKIFDDYKFKIKSATNEKTDHIASAQYVDLEKIEWGHIPEIPDLLSYISAIALDLRETNEDKEIVRKIDEFARNSFKLTVDSFDGTKGYMLTISLQFKDKLVQVVPELKLVRVRAADASCDDEGQEFSYDEYFK